MAQGTLPYPALELTEYQRQALAGVFGYPLFNEIYDQVEILEREDCTRAYTVHWDLDWAPTIVLPPRPEFRTILHEFGHAWAILEWPKEAMLAPQDRNEAVAFYVEACYLLKDDLRKDLARALLTGQSI